MQPATHSNNNTSVDDRLSSYADHQGECDGSSTKDINVDVLSRVLADQQLDYDDLSEMRPREPSIILPPPNNFTVVAEHHNSKSSDTNSRASVNSATKASSSSVQDEKQKMKQIKLWIIHGLFDCIVLAVLLVHIVYT